LYSIVYNDQVAADGERHDTCASLAFAGITEHLWNVTTHLARHHYAQVRNIHPIIAAQ
jgi:hypothetical protein